MRRITTVFLVLLGVTLMGDILVRLTKPTPAIINGTITGVPILTNWIDFVLAIEFGIPVIMEFYSRFL